MLLALTELVAKAVALDSPRQVSTESYSWLPKCSAPGTGSKHFGLCEGQPLLSPLVASKQKTMEVSIRITSFILMILALDD